MKNECVVFSACVLRARKQNTNQSQFEYDWIVYRNKNEGITWAMVILENSNDIINE
jgi:hypothetical protein